jgi:hypothetical protein
MSEILACKVTLTVTNPISVLKWNARVWHIEHSIGVFVCSFEIIGLHWCFHTIEVCILKQTVTSAIDFNFWCNLA